MQKISQKAIKKSIIATGLTAGATSAIVAPVAMTTNGNTPKTYSSMPLEDSVDYGGRHFETYDEMIDFIKSNVKKKNESVIGTREYVIYEGISQHAFGTYDEMVAYISGKYVTTKSVYPNDMNNWPLNNSIIQEVGGGQFTNADSKAIYNIYRKSDGTYTFSIKGDAVGDARARLEAAKTYVQLHNAYFYDNHYFATKGDIENYINEHQQDVNTILKQYQSKVKTLQFANGTYQSFSSFDEVKDMIIQNAAPMFKDKNGNLIPINQENLTRLAAAIDVNGISAIPISSNDNKVEQVVDMDVSTPNGSLFGPYITSSGIGVDGIMDPGNWSPVSSSAALSEYHESLEESVLASFVDYMLFANNIGGAIPLVFNSLIPGDASKTPLSSFLAKINPNKDYSQMLDGFLHNLARGTRYSTLNAFILSYSYIVDKMIKGQEKNDDIEMVAQYYDSIAQTLDTYLSAALSPAFVAKGENVRKLNIDYFHKTFDFYDKNKSSRIAPFQVDPMSWWRKLIGRDTDTPDGEQNHNVFKLITAYMGSVSVLMKRASDYDEMFGKFADGIKWYLYLYEKMGAQDGGKIKKDDIYDNVEKITKVEDFKTIFGDRSSHYDWTGQNVDLTKIENLSDFFDDVSAYLPAGSKSDSYSLKFNIDISKNFDLKDWSDTFDGNTLDVNGDEFKNIWSNISKENIGFINYSTEDGIKTIGQNQISSNFKGFLTENINTIMKKLVQNFNDNAQQYTKEINSDSYNIEDRYKFWKEGDGQKLLSVMPSDMMASTMGLRKYATTIPSETAREAALNKSIEDQIPGLEQRFLAFNANFLQPVSMLVMNAVIIHQSYLTIKNGWNNLNKSSASASAGTPKNPSVSTQAPHQNDDGNGGTQVKVPQEHLGQGGQTGGERILDDTVVMKVPNNFSDDASSELDIDSVSQAGNVTDSNKTLNGSNFTLDSESAGQITMSLENQAVSFINKNKTMAEGGVGGLIHRFAAPNGNIYTQVNKMPGVSHTTIEPVDPYSIDILKMDLDKLDEDNYSEGYSENYSTLSLSDFGSAHLSRAASYSSSDSGESYRLSTIEEVDANGSSNSGDANQSVAANVKPFANMSKNVQATFLAANNDQPIVASQNDSSDSDLERTRAIDGLVNAYKEIKEKLPVKINSNDLNLQSLDFSGFLQKLSTNSIFHLAKALTSDKQVNWANIDSINQYSATPEIIGNIDRVTSINVKLKLQSLPVTMSPEDLLETLVLRDLSSSDLEQLAKQAQLASWEQTFLKGNLSDLGIDFSKLNAGDKPEINKENVKIVNSLIAILDSKNLYLDPRETMNLYAMPHEQLAEFISDFSEQLQKVSRFDQIKNIRALQPLIKMVETIKDESTKSGALSHLSETLAQSPDFKVGPDGNYLALLNRINDYIYQNDDLKQVMIDKLTIYGLDIDKLNAKDPAHLMNGDLETIIFSEDIDRKAYIESLMVKQFLSIKKFTNVSNDSYASLRDLDRETVINLMDYLSENFEHDNASIVPEIIKDNGLKSLAAKAAISGWIESHNGKISKDELMKFENLPSSTISMFMRNLRANESGAVPLDLKGASIEGLEDLAKIFESVKNTGGNVDMKKMFSILDGTDSLIANMKTYFQSKGESVYTKEVQEGLEQLKNDKGLSMRVLLIESILNEKKYDIPVEDEMVLVKVPLEQLDKFIGQVESLPTSGSPVEVVSLAQAIMAIEAVGQKTSPEIFENYPEIKAIMDFSQLSPEVVSGFGDDIVNGYPNLIQKLNKENFSRLFDGFQVKDKLAKKGFGISNQTIYDYAIDPEPSDVNALENLKDWSEKLSEEDIINSKVKVTDEAVMELEKTVRVDRVAIPDWMIGELESRVPSRVFDVVKMIDDSYRKYDKFIKNEQGTRPELMRILDTQIYSRDYINRIKQLPSFKEAIDLKYAMGLKGITLNDRDLLDIASWPREDVIEVTREVEAIGLSDVATGGIYSNLSSMLPSLVNLESALREKGWKINHSQLQKILSKATTRHDLDDLADKIRSGKCKIMTNADGEQVLIPTVERLNESAWAKNFFNQSTNRALRFIDSPSSVFVASELHGQHGEVITLKDDGTYVESTKMKVNDKGEVVYKENPIFDSLSSVAAPLTPTDDNGSETLHESAIKVIKALSDVLNRATSPITLDEVDSTTGEIEIAGEEFSVAAVTEVFDHETIKEALDRPVQNWITFESEKSFEQLENTKNNLVAPSEGASLDANGLDWAHNLERTINEKLAIDSPGDVFSNEQIAKMSTLERSVAEVISRDVAEGNFFTTKIEGQTYLFLKNENYLDDSLISGTRPKSVNAKMFTDLFWNKNTGKYFDIKDFNMQENESFAITKLLNPTTGITYTLNGYNKYVPSIDGAVLPGANGQVFDVDDIDEIVSGSIVISGQEYVVNEITKYSLDEDGKYVFDRESKGETLFKSKEMYNLIWTLSNKHQEITDDQLYEISKTLSPDEINKITETINKGEKGSFLRVADDESGKIFLALKGEDDAVLRPTRPNKVNSFIQKVQTDEIAIEIENSGIDNLIERDGISIYATPNEFWDQQHNVLEQETSSLGDAWKPMDDAISAANDGNGEINQAKSKAIVNAVTSFGSAFSNIASMAFGPVAMAAGVIGVVTTIMGLINNFSSTTVTPYAYTTYDGKTFYWNGATTTSKFWGLSSSANYTIKNLKLINDDVIVSGYSANEQGVYSDGKFYFDNTERRMDVAQDMVSTINSIDRFSNSSDQKDFSKYGEVVWQSSITNIPNESDAYSSSIEDLVNRLRPLVNSVPEVNRSLFSVIDDALTDSASKTLKQVIDNIIYNIKPIVILRRPDMDENGNPKLAGFELPVPYYVAGTVKELPAGVAPATANKDFVVYNPNINSNIEADASLDQKSQSFFAKIKTTNIDQAVSNLVDQVAKGIVAPSKSALFDQLSKDESFDKIENYDFSKNIRTIHTFVTPNGTTRYFASLKSALNTLLNENNLNYSYNDAATDKYVFNEMEFNTIGEIVQYLKTNFASTKSEATKGGE